MSLTKPILENPKLIEISLLHFTIRELCWTPCLKTLQTETTIMQTMKHIFMNKFTHHNTSWQCFSAWVKPQWTQNLSIFDKNNWVIVALCVPLMDYKLAIQSKTKLVHRMASFLEFQKKKSKHLYKSNVYMWKNIKQHDLWAK